MFDKDKLLTEFRAYQKYCEVQRQTFQKEIDLHLSIIGGIESNRDRALLQAREQFEAFLQEYIENAGRDAEVVIADE